MPDDLEIARHAEEAEREAFRGAPKRAYEDALLAHVPVDHFLDAYFNGAKLAQKTKNARRGLINQFARWCVEEKLTLDRIDRRIIGRYVTQRIDAMHPTTAYAHLIALRHYWVYLHARGHISNGDDKGGAWVGQQIKDNSRRVERGSQDTERPFTAEEVITLIHSPYPVRQRPEFQEQIMDALKMSLLSGMRMAEVLTLWAGEVHDGVFDIQQGKTDAAARRVPIHPDLVEIVERRTKGKGPEEWLFHELQNERDAGDTFGKRFHRYRLKLGVDDKHADRRRSLVNFHSARRWFVQSARDAGHPSETVGDVVGHVPNKRDITFGVYTRGASEAHKRQCVESLKLPIAEAP
ncbi:tyrosine-type recombinase/integrase [Pseudogemmobacter sp. W21_MBD1_M6]|uniref:tyrosine-type recombinase/integrase n=1 Tax=Pseudogemmobacter sp. W21_MBD1_M6 TaxID=3240271 RepID=UPI003F97A8A5